MRCRWRMAAVLMVGCSLLGPHGGTGANTDDVLAMFKTFRGREPAAEPLLEKRGLVHATTTPN